MNDPRHKLTAEIQGLICGLIRAGAFPHVAAEAAGIPQRVFERWLRYGQARQPAEEYRVFAAEVMQARAHARALAEADARKRAPVTWLRSGPGRESDGKPGWTGMVRPAPLASPEAPGYNERVWKIFPRLLDALAPFPEARMAAAAVLAQEGMRRAKEVVAAGQAQAATAEAAQPQAAGCDPTVKAARTDGEPIAKPPATQDELGHTGNENAAHRQPSTIEAATNVPRTDGEATAKPSGTLGEVKVNRPLVVGPMTTNLRSISIETAANAGSRPREKPRATVERPSAWDPLNAGHWTVWSP